MVRRLFKFIAVAAIAIGLLATTHSTVFGCPTCGQALGHQDPSHAGVAKGFYYSILFMMGMPYLVLSTFCGCMYWKVRRARAERAKADRPPTPTASSIPPAPSVSRVAPTSAPATAARPEPLKPREPVEV